MAESVVYYMVLTEDVTYIGTESKLLLYNPLHTITVMKGLKEILRIALAVSVSYDEIDTLGLEITDELGECVYRDMNLKSFFDSNKHELEKGFYTGNLIFTADEGVRFFKSGMYKVAFIMNKQERYQSFFQSQRVNTMGNLLEFKQSMKTVTFPPVNKKSIIKEELEASKSDSAQQFDKATACYSAAFN